jgi:hypothetical protein
LGLAAVSPNQGFDGPHNISLYDTRNPASNDVFITQFETPGIARAVAIYNGLCYVADHANGMHVINYLAYDNQGRAPSGTLTTTSTNGTVVEGARLVISASVADDVQVRNVEFRINGVKYVVDGNFPFEVGWRAPTNSVGQKVTLTAVVSDTGGNTTNLGPIELTIVADNQPPSVAISSPTTNQIFFVGDLISIDVNTFDNVGVASLTFQIDGVTVSPIRQSLAQWFVVAPTSRGFHQLTLIAADFSGHTTSLTRQFRVMGEAISREFTLFNFDSPEIKDAVSREFSVFNFDPAEIKDAISREFSVENKEAAGPAAPQQVNRK